MDITYTKSNGMWNSVEHQRSITTEEFIEHGRIIDKLKYGNGKNIEARHKLFAKYVEDLAKLN